VALTLQLLEVLQYLESLRPPVVRALTSHNKPVPITTYSPGGGTTAHSVLTSHNTPAPTTPYSPGEGTTAHSVLTSHNTPVPTTPYSPGGGTTAHSVLTSHSKPTQVHRDIKPANILFDRTGDGE
jgi:serine/threonine protein kinase